MNNYPSWLWPVKRQCTAKSKRSGQRCKNWSCKNRTVCRFHGGRSTGPKTPEGRKASAAANLKDGEYSLGVLKKRLLERYIELFTIREGEPPLEPTVIYFRTKISPMNYRQVRAGLAEVHRQLRLEKKNDSL